MTTTCKKNSTVIHLQHIVSKSTILPDYSSFPLQYYSSQHLSPKLTPCNDKTIITSNDCPPEMCFMASSHVGRLWFVGLWVFTLSGKRQICLKSKHFIV